MLCCLFIQSEYVLSPELIISPIHRFFGLSVVTKFANKKLTISLVSELTTIPFETTRRKIKKLVKKNWITYTKENGIVYNSNSELNDKIVNKIHPIEKDLLKEFLVSYIMSGKDN